ncbi:hypothetical protein NMG60_11017542 [Bertholletia excelsa]
MVSSKTHFIYISFIYSHQSKTKQIKRLECHLEKKIRLLQLCSDTQQQKQHLSTSRFCKKNDIALYIILARLETVAGSAKIQFSEDHNDPTLFNSNYSGRDGYVPVGKGSNV